MHVSFFVAVILNLVSKSFSVLTVDYRCFCLIHVNIFALFFTKENTSNLDLLIPETSMPTIIDKV